MLDPTAVQPLDRHLFVYGTLMLSVAAPMGRSERQRLAREAVSLGPATTEGRLYDLGRYPGLVLDGAEGQCVHGELLELSDPASSLKWLDAYEGIVPGRAGRHEYARLERPVVLADGRTVLAFVYAYLADISDARLVPDGRWTPLEP